MDKWSEIRAVYTDIPLENGDALIVTDLSAIQQVDGLADHWDPTVRRFVVKILTEMDVREVRLAIARPGAELLPQDHALWADLREELLGSGIRVLAPEGLPAAA